MPEGTLSPAAAPPAFVPPEPECAPADLRPLSTSELIDRGFALYRAHFAGFLLLALLCQTAPLLNQALVTSARLSPTQNELFEQPRQAVTKMGLLMASGLVTQLIVFCFEVVLTAYIADAYLGKIPSVSASLRQFTVRLGASVWTGLLNMILIGGAFLFPAMAVTVSYLGALFYPPTSWLFIFLYGAGAALLFFASLVPVLVVFMRIWVTTPAVALEGLAGWKAVRRSAQLVRFDPGLGVLYWGEMRLSFLLLPLFIIELLILSLTSLPMVLFQVSEMVRHGSGGQMMPPPDATVILSQILTFLGISLILPLYPIATTLFYYDIRIRREGFDLEVMARQLGART